MTGQRRGALDRVDDADADVADLGGDGDPLLVDRELVDRRGLEVVEHLAGGGGLELVEERRRRCRVDDALGGRLEDDARLDGHGGVLSRRGSGGGADGAGSRRKASSSRLTSPAWVTHMTCGPPSIST